MKNLSGKGIGKE